MNHRPRAPLYHRFYNQVGVAKSSGLTAKIGGKENIDRRGLGLGANGA